MILGQLVHGTTTGGVLRMRSCPSTCSVSRSSARRLFLDSAFARFFCARLICLAEPSAITRCMISATSMRAYHSSSVSVAANSLIRSR